MAEERSNLGPEVVQILEHIDAGENFLLSGGAGSGKTYSLIQVIEHTTLAHPKAKIACITYTNAAVKEIESRISQNNLTVSTIHDFLWDNIKLYQKQIKEALVVLVNQENSKIPGVNGPIEAAYFDHLKDGIQYKEWNKISEGIISHDEVLLLAFEMFKSFPLLRSILKDRYRFIFVDEYQDTDAKIISILIDFLSQSKKANVVGFFGDAMQSIYDDGIGDLSSYVKDGRLKEVKKEQNRRNPLAIIDLANKLRTDSIRQSASDDISAPNMQNGVVKQGKIQFLYSDSNDWDAAKRYTGWNYDDSENTRELILTHRLIAPRAKIENLFDIYDGDPVMKLKGHLVSELKEKQKADAEIMSRVESMTFEQVVDWLNLQKNKSISWKDETTSKAKDLYDLVKDKPFLEIRRMYISKDSLTDDKKQDNAKESTKGSKRDKLLRHLFKIHINVSHYLSGEYNDFIRNTDYKIRKVADKIKLRQAIDELSVLTAKGTIEEVVELAHRSGVCVKDDSFTDFVDANWYLYYRVKQVRFLEIQNLFSYVEGNTPFSTQHKTKGAEYDRVLVILDNGNWRDYNFNALFDADRRNSESVLERTQKLFYVCCTRAKEELVIYFSKPSANVLQTARSWFGSDNVIKV